MCLDSTVFFIENDAAVQDAFSISLSMAGLKIEIFPSGKAFLEAYNKDRSGCLLIDLCQPERESLAVQKELIRRNCPIPIIFMTGIGSIRDSMSIMRSGVYYLLEKPFSRLSLLEIIREAMEQDCGNRSAIKTRGKRTIASSITPEKYSKPMKTNLNTSALSRAHLTELGRQFTLCASSFYPAVQLA